MVAVWNRFYTSSGAVWHAVFPFPFVYYPPHSQTTLTWDMLLMITGN